jgi:hypothetical protein
MIRWLRRVLASFGGYFELLGRLEDLEVEIERLRELVTAHEIEWVNQVDKLVTLHKRSVKRIQDGTAALNEAVPSVMDVRAQRAIRKANLRRGVTDGSSATS